MLDWLVVTFSVLVVGGFSLWFGYWLTKQVVETDLLCYPKHRYVTEIGLYDVNKHNREASDPEVVHCRGLQWEYGDED